MKKLSFIAALTLSTMLSACGGGGHGGHIPSTLPTIPDNPSTPSGNAPESFDNTTITEMKARVIDDKDGFTALAQERLGDSYQTNTPRKAKARFAMARAGVQEIDDELNQKLLDNMIKVLVENNWNGVSADDYEKALLLAGFDKEQLAELNDATSYQNFIKEHQTDIKEGIDSVYAHASLTIDNAKMRLVEQDEEGTQNSFINLTLNKSGKIDGIEISKNKEAYKLTRDGNKNKFDNEHTVYRYGINNTYYTGIFVESLTPLEPNEWKARLKARIKEIEPSQAYDEGNEEHNHQLAEELIKAVDEITDYVEGNMKDLKGENGNNPKELFYTSYTKKESAEYTSYAKDLKLAYSDFGTISLTGSDTFKDNKNEINETKTFAGGYEKKKIAANDIQNDITFSGRAVGAINYLKGENESDKTLDTGKLELDTNATLEFNAKDKTQTLTANFDNWYNLEATTDMTGKGDLTLSGGEKIADNKFKFHEQIENAENPINEDILKYKDEYTINDFTTAKQIKTDKTGHSEPTYGSMEVGYYGDNGKPSEATGYVYYSEGFGWTNKEGKEVGDRIFVNIGFGAKKD
ncbi:MAG: hypothetical protein NC311_11845 [Muribaculaceae bacterium]|nr:hypothetical protein [Muribaculaceae bacterium]